MRGVILAAGRGSRLGSLTASVPKCLVKLDRRTLLDWQLSALRAAGVSDITVVGGHRSDLLTGEFDLRRNERWAETNMVSTLCTVSNLLAEGPAVVSYSDIVYHPSHIERLAAVPELAITYDREWLALWRERFADPLSDAESFRCDGGYVVDLGRRATLLSEVQGQYMGLIKFTSDAWRTVEEVLGALTAQQVDRLDLTSLLRLVVDSGFRLAGVPVHGRWCEVDTESDLCLYAHRLNDSGWLHDWRWNEEG